MSARTSAAVVAIAVFVLMGMGSADYVRDAAERVKAADWTKMKTLSVTQKEYAFEPSTLVFREGVPYKLVITNIGTSKHYFTAENFFKAIATRKVQNTDGEIKAPYFKALEVFPGRSMDLYFIPVKKGAYNFLCTIEGHAEHGMKGHIRIE
jgi:uncharacterized cupredoxin-like copper-binding protein